MADTNTRIMFTIPIAFAFANIIHVHCSSKYTISFLHKSLFITLERDHFNCVNKIIIIKKKHTQKISIDIQENWNFQITNPSLLYFSLRLFFSYANHSTRVTMHTKMHTNTTHLHKTIFEIDIDIDTNTTKKSNVNQKF